MHEWINLTNHLGKNFSNPKDIQLTDALHQLFTANDNEHPDAWIECGTEDGPLYSLSVYAGGYAIYSKFNNADMDVELENKKINNVTAQVAFDLWKNLIDGNIKKIVL